MNCRIECKEPRLNPLDLFKRGFPSDKRVKWFTNDKDVTYCLDIPGGIFVECPSGTCEFQVKFGQNVELNLDPNAKATKQRYYIRVCVGTLPANCKVLVAAPPEIIVNDDKKKVKPAAKKAAGKKKAK